MAKGAPYPYLRESSVFNRLKKLLGIRPHVDYSSVGRNDVCLCGSGRKFKGCCMERVEKKDRAVRDAKAFGNRKG